MDKRCVPVKATGEWEGGNWCEVCATHHGPLYVYDHYVHHLAAIIADASFALWLEMHGHD